MADLSELKRQLELLKASKMATHSHVARRIRELEAEIAALEAQKG